MREGEILETKIMMQIEVGHMNDKIEIEEMLEMLAIVD